MRRILPLILLLLPALASAQTTSNPLTRNKVEAGDFTPTGTWDFTGGKLRMQRGATCPPAAASCNASDEVGQMYVCTGGADVYVCSDSALGWERVSPRSSRVLTVCPTAGECEYTVGCNADCTTPAQPCAAGSAYVAADALLTADPNSEVEIAYGPGSYSECWLIDDIAGLTISGAGVDATWLETYSDQRPVIEIGTITTTAQATRNITFQDMSIYGTYGHTDGGVSIGATVTSGNEASWDDIRFLNTRIVSPGVAVALRGSMKASDTETPEINFDGGEVIAGGIAFNKSGYVNFTKANGATYVSPNYYDVDATINASAPLFTAEVNGQVANDPVNNSDSLIIVSTVGAPGACVCIEVGEGDFCSFNGELSDGRKITVTNLADPNTAADPNDLLCGTLDGLDGFQTWITDSDFMEVPGQEWLGTTCGFRVDPTTGGEAFDAGCDFKIDAVGNIGSHRRATDRAWMSNSAWAGSPKSFVRLSGSQPSPPPPSASMVFKSEKMSMEINTGSAYGSYDQTSQVVGVAHPQGHDQLVTFQDVLFNIGISMDMYDSCTGSSCVTLYRGNGTTKSGQISDEVAFRNSKVIIRNTADPDIDTSLVNVAGTGEVVLLDGLYAEIDNSVGGYAGSETYLVQSAGTLLKCGVAGPETINSSGTITLASGGCSSTGTATLDFNFGGGADQGTCLAAQTITVAGAALSDSVDLGIPNGSVIAGVKYEAWVSAANTVSVQPCCVTAADCADTASGTYSARVTRP